MRALMIATVACASPAMAETTCYKLETPRQGVETMVATPAGELWYTLTGYPELVHTIACPLTGLGKNTCQVECDGGQITMALDGEGMEVTTPYVRIEKIIFESILTDADSFGGLSISGDWRLSPAPTSACTDILDVAPPITLGPGDIAAVVKELEAHLLAGGYFVGGPDYLYDTDTAQAVALYQHELGLDPTGHVDRALANRLRLEASAGFSGC